MTVQDKIKTMNEAATKLREGMDAIAKAFKGDGDIEYYVWKINKTINVLHQAVCHKLENQINDSEFKSILKQLEDKDHGV